MSTGAVDSELKGLRKRIKELNEKASQMLLFLSFAIVGAATVKQTSLSALMACWCDQ